MKNNNNIDKKIYRAEYETFLLKNGCIVLFLKKMLCNGENLTSGLPLYLLRVDYSSMISCQLENMFMSYNSNTAIKIIAIARDTLSLQM